MWKWMWFVHAYLPIGRLTSVRTVDLRRKEWLNSSAVFNPNHNRVNAAPKQASLQSTPPCNPQAKLLNINVLVSIPICEMKIKTSGIAH